MCIKSGKFSAEVGIQCGKFNIKMLPVWTDYVDGQIGSPFPLSYCKLLYFQWMSRKSLVKLEGESGKTISVGCCFPPKSANSGTLNIV